MPAWGLRILLKRHCLPGQRRLVDEEILCRNQSHVGGDHVAGRQQHDVARARAARSALRSALARSRQPAGARSRCSAPSAAARRQPRRAVLLKETERDAEEHHDGDHDRGPLIADEVGRRRERQQQPVQRVDRAADRSRRRSCGALVCATRWADRAQPLLDLIRSETFRSSVKTVQRFLWRKASDLTEANPARGQSFGCGRVPRHK